MKILLDLFGVHIAFVSVILLLFLMWLFWPRRFRAIRKTFIRASGLVLLVGVLLALKTYWPYDYEKSYLNTPVAQEVKSTPLKAFADSIGFHIGIATSSQSEHKDLIAKEFNSLVAENDFKPGKLLVDAANWKFDFTKADQLLDFAEANGMRMRGHTLVWGKFPGMTYPGIWGKLIAESADKEKTLEDLMSRYIDTVMGHFKGRVSTWDVVNEPMGGTELYPSPFTKAMGEAYIDLAFKLARKADPDATLFLNEQIPDFNAPGGKALLELLERLKERNVPIDGVGLQCHNIKRLADLDGLRRYIRAIGELGLKVEITELDIRLLLLGGEDDPYAAQGNYFGEIAKICLVEPACEGLTFWGLSDKNNWMDSVPPFKWKSPNAPNIFDDEMNRKPAYLGVWNALKEVSSN